MVSCRIPVIASTDGRHGILQHCREMQITGPGRCLTSQTAHTWIRNTYQRLSVPAEGSHRTPWDLVMEISIYRSPHWSELRHKLPSAACDQEE